MIRKNGKKIVNLILKESLILDYFTPGQDIAAELYRKYNNENIIFLLNHGVIFTSDNYNEIYELIEDTLLKFENFLNEDFSLYKMVNRP